MKSVGLIGGIAPESTIQYYRQIIESYRARLSDGSYPSVIINSIDMTRMLGLIDADQLPNLVKYLVEEIRNLHKAGADFAVLASNTPHIVFAELQKSSPIPLISIVEAACDAAKASNLKRLGLLGTRFTMQGSMYPDVFTSAGISVVQPTPEEQSYVHEKYIGELAKGIFLPETRKRLIEIIGRMRTRENIDGVILGGTELPLILTEAKYDGIPTLDTTKLHVARIVAEILGS